MKVIKIISIINQGGEYSITTTYNEVDDNGAIVKRNVKAPTFYAVGDMLDHVKAIEDNIWRESERSREALFILLKIAPAQPEKV